MTDKWLPGETYPPGSLVIPASQPAVDATQATNGDFAAGNTGWDYTGSCAFSSTGGYSNANCCIAPGVTAGGLALNQAHFLMAPGESISASCMIQQGASDVDHTRGYVQVLFFDASDVQIGDPISGNIINDGRNGAWHPSSVAAAAPAGTAYARCGIYLYQNSADPIWGDNLVVTYARRAPQAGLVFKATQAAPGKSAQTEPVWPTTTGVPVTDNEVTWEGVIATRLIWQASPILKSGATEPTWPLQVGGAVRDGTIDWIAVSRRIEDPNCPNSKVVAIMASKVFAADGDIVRFSATINPLDWTSEQNAGYLPTGLQQANGNDMAVLAPYRSNLTAFNPSSFQNWQVDPDPASMALLDQMDGIGSNQQHAAQAVGNDLYYLSQLGVRTVSIAAGTDNLNAGDVGMPIDVLVQDAMRVAAANASKVLATYYPSAGQYWLSFSQYPPDELVISGSLPDGATGVAVDFTYAMSGGVKPYGPLTVTSGTLPTGLAMDSAGHVTGSVSAGGIYTWTVGVTDAAGSPASNDDSASFYVPATFDPATATSTASLSNGNRDITMVNNAIQAARANTLKTTGKWYVEYQIISAPGYDNVAIWVQDAGRTPVSSNTGGAGVLAWHSDGSFYLNGSYSGGGLPGFSTGAVLGVAFDTATRQVWLRNAAGWALVDTSSPSTLVLSAVTANLDTGAWMNYIAGVTQHVRINAGQEAFAYPVPAGFLPLSTP